MNSSIAEIMLHTDVTMLYRYQDNRKIEMKHIERVQTGIRIERRLLKVMKGLAEQLDMSVAELVEGLALHAFEGKAPFGRETIEKIEKLKDVYDLDLTAEDSHKLLEA
jgi:hypothetical protein